MNTLHTEQTSVAKNYSGYCFVLIDTLSVSLKLILSMQGAVE